MSLPRAIAPVVAIGVATLALSACVAKSPADSAGPITVTSTATECTLAVNSARSGSVTFDVTNKGTETTEFYLLAEDGLRIIAEVENVAPGAQRSLTLVAQPGKYVTLCKPGMVGDGVGKAPFTVTGDAVKAEGDDVERRTEAVEQYADFVQDQVEQLEPAAKTFADAYAAGDDDAAKKQFPQVRAFYERIEPIADSLGDLDPKIDYREVDAVAEGMDWTGFHRIEKDLWQPAKDALNADGATPAWKDWQPSTATERRHFADQLVADIATLADYVHGADFTEALEEQGVAGLSNGAIALLDEVASGKITGEEDWWSGTDLYDFAANIEGSRMAFSLVRDLAAGQGADGKALAEKIDGGYEALETKLASYGNFTDGFVAYQDLTDADSRALTDLINALAEPLSQLTSTILA
jgi:iron uptake system component EfeO